MIAIDNVLLSDDIIAKEFACNLNACKGACCYEGDYGAPLEDSELATLKAIYPDVKPFLRQEGIDVIEQDGLYKYYETAGEYGTTLIDNKACVFAIKDELGRWLCGIEAAYRAGKVKWMKPLSCHLYPIRIDEYETYHAVNYDTWNICSPACESGKKQGIRVYEFVKDGLIRKYGEEFYEQLDAYAKQQDENDQNK